MQAVMSRSLPNFGRFCLAVVFGGYSDLADAAWNVKFAGHAEFTGMRNSLGGISLCLQVSLRFR
jgi:hypothetical protein